MESGGDEWTMTDDHLGAYLRLVSDSDRRKVIRCLRHEAEGRIAVDDLVDQLWRRESVTTADPQTDRDRIAIDLVHTHLPKLADHGVVDLDLQRETVRYRPDERIDAVLDSLPEEVMRTNAD